MKEGGSHLINLPDLIYLLKFVLLGFVQGFTEPLPISSSGHIVIFRDILGIHTTGLSFEIIVHFASLIAIIMVYWKDIVTLFTEGMKFVLRREAKYAGSFRIIVYLLIATFITGVIGLFVEDYVSEELATPFYAGIALLVTGVFVWIIRNLEGHKSDEEITLKDTIIIGLAQTCALIPGISRSGATVVAAMLLGLKRETALRFSFLLAIPVILGVNVLSIKDIAEDHLLHVNLIPYIVAFIVTLLATYFALKWFINVMARGKLVIFSIYCFIVGTGVIIHQTFF